MLGGFWTQVGWENVPLICAVVLKEVLILVKPVLRHLLLLNCTYNVHWYSRLQNQSAFFVLGISNIFL